MNMAQLEAKTLEELRGVAKGLEIVGYSKLKKDDLILKIGKGDTDTIDLHGIIGLLDQGPLDHPAVTKE